jgi:ribosome-associated protein
MQNSHNGMSDEFDDEYDGPSKSEIKRQMLARQDLAKTLSELSIDQIKSLPVEDRLKEKLLETEKIKTFGAIKRHKLFIGKLMRALDDEEISAIEARLEAIKGVNKVEIAKFHHLERLREDLLSNDSRLTQLIQDHPGQDLLNLRTLIRNARKEKAENKPPKAFREIFQILKALDGNENTPETE